MIDDPIKSIDSLIRSPSSSLNEILQIAAGLTDYQTLLEEYLDPNLLNHCAVASYSKGILILVVDNATWATHLRFLAPDLIKFLQKKAPTKDIKKIECKVRPNQTTPTVKQSPIPGISKESSESLATGAMGITHKELRGSLLKLAENGLKVSKQRHDEGN